MDRDVWAANINLDKHQFEWQLEQDFHLFGKALLGQTFDKVAHLACNLNFIRMAFLLSLSRRT